MTNNPRKLDALKELEISTERVAHIARSTDKNQRYLQTKAKKLGHLLTPVRAGTEE
jgi:GTP cyclohydrolase II